MIEAAADADRLEEYRRVAAFQRNLGLEVEEISPREMADLFPWAKTDDLLAGFHVPGDGRVNPVDLTMALAKGARQLGVRVVEGVSVTDVLTDRGRVTGVTGRHGARGRDGRRSSASTSSTAPACGPASSGERNGLVIPNQAAEHYYLITDTIDGLDPDAPVFEDPSSYGYYREEGGGMMVGLFEPQAAPWKVEGIPRRLLLRHDPARLGPDGARSWRRRWHACRSPSRSASARSSAVRSRSPPTSPPPSARLPGSATTSSPRA